MNVNAFPAFFPLNVDQEFLFFLFPAFFLLFLFSSLFISFFSLFLFLSLFFFLYSENQGKMNNNNHEAEMRGKILSSFFLFFFLFISFFFIREREFGRLFNRKERGRKEGRKLRKEEQEESGKRADRMEFHALFLFFLPFSFSSLFSLLLLIFLLSSFSLNETMNRLLLPSYFPLFGSTALKVREKKKERRIKRKSGMKTKRMKGFNFVTFLDFYCSKNLGQKNCSNFILSYIFSFFFLLSLYFFFPFLSSEEIFFFRDFLCSFTAT